MVGRLLIPDRLVELRVKALTDRFDRLVAKLNEGEGTMGRLLKDRQLYENMNGAVNDVRSLVEAIKKDPKKYLSVRVSIF